MGGYTTKKRLVRGTFPASLRTPSGTTNYPELSAVPDASSTVMSYRSKGVDQDPAQDIINLDLLKSLERDNDVSQPPFDTGHEFDSYQRRVLLSHPRVRLVSADGRSEYIGPLVPSSANIAPSAYGFSEINSAVNTSYYGPKLIAKAAPTNPYAGIGQFLGEVHEGLPQLAIHALQGRVGFFRGLGSDYLNVQFGWLPFIKDITNILKAVKRSSAVIQQFERDAGRVVRRKVGFAPIEERITDSFSQGVTGATLFPGGIPGGSAVFASGYATGKVYQELVKQTNYWFSGAFQYYLPDGSSIIDKVVHFERLADKLLGIRITPDVLWELTPWSWLVDWYANIGANISNYDRFYRDGLVMRYGYLMCHRTTRSSVRLTGLRQGTGAAIGPVEIAFYVDRKQRVRATPYGFGLSSSGFSEGQWAILGALGLTKGPKTLP